MACDRGFLRARFGNAKLNNLTRHRVAVITLAALALTSSFWILLDVAATYSASADTFGVAAFERRFDVLRKALPPHSVLGYVSDNPVNDARAQAEYFLTLYTLAPNIVKASTEEKLVVANFHTNAPDKALLQRKHLQRLQDYGNDVFLYHNTTR